MLVSNIKSSELHKAINNNDISKVRIAIQKRIDLDKKGEFGRTPLLLATLLAKEEIVKLLINAGANLDIQDDFGRTALMTAVLLERTTTGAISAIGLKIAKLLIDANADIYLKSKTNKTALDYANKNSNIAKLLYEKAIHKNLNKKDQQLLNNDVVSVICSY
jgi:ankyrin repeat protein